MPSLESFLEAISIIIVVATTVVGFITLVKWICEWYTPKSVELTPNSRGTLVTSEPPPPTDKPAPKKLKAGECVSCGHIHDKRDRGEDTAYGQLLITDWGDITYIKFNCANCSHSLNYEWTDMLIVPEVVPRTIDPANIRVVYRKTDKGIHREYREVISKSSDLHNTEVLTIPCTSEDTYPDMMRRARELHSSLEKEVPPYIVNGPLDLEEKSDG